MTAAERVTDVKDKRIPWWFKRKENRPVRYEQDYTIVSSVSGAIARLLQEKLVPEVVESRELIGLCEPADHGDITLGIWLYDIQENDETRVNGMVALDGGRMTYPPIYLNLYYMITAYSSTDMRYRAEEEHRLMGKTMQVLRDHSVLDADTLMPTEEPAAMDLRIEYNRIDLEEKMKVWNGCGIPYRLSLFYCVSPVGLESLIRKDVSRVREIRTDLVQSEDRAARTGRGPRG